MNCKPGDVALWTTRGVLVDVVCPAIAGEIFTSVCGKRRWLLTRNVAAPAWVVQTTGQPQLGWPQTKDALFTRLAVYDCSLIPIRDNPGEDESFRWATSPTQKELA